MTEETNTTETIVETIDMSNFDGEAAANSAIEMARREDDGMSFAMNKVLQGKEDWQGGPVSVLIAMLRAFGTLDGFPVPDSETGNNPDKFKRQMEVGGKLQFRQTTWYTIFSDNTKEGRAILSELAMFNGVGKEGYDQSLISTTIKDMSPVQRQSRIDYLKGRRATIRGAYKKAIRLALQYAAIQSLAGVTCNFIWKEGPDGKPLNFESGNPQVETSGKCLSVVTTNVNRITKDWECMSIANFLRLDPAEAANNGGTYAALMKTKERGTQEGGNTTGVVPLPNIDDIKTFSDYMLNLHIFTDKTFGGKASPVYGQLLKTLNGPGSDDLLNSIFEVVNDLGQITRMDKFAARYAAMQDKEARKVG